MTDADGISPTSATIDHRVPRALGGPDSLHNYVACCLKCNLDKADEMPDLPPKKINKNVRKKVKKPADAHIQAERAARKMAERRSLAR